MHTGWIKNITHETATFKQMINSVPFVSMDVWKICTYLIANAAADAARRENTKPLQKPSET